MPTSALQIELDGLAIVYDPAADRLRLKARWPGGARDLMLTRRLTAELLRVLADRIEAQSAGNIVFDHIELARPPKARPRAATDQPAADGERRIDQIVASPRRQGVVLTLQDTVGDRYRLGLTRASAHRTLDTLLRRSRHAAWRVDARDWLVNAADAVGRDQLGLARH